MTAQLPQPRSRSGSDLYEQDFYLWIQTTAALLKQKDFTQLDLEHLIEEIETMGRSEKRALESNVAVLLMHILKYQFQPMRRSHSWRYTIAEHRKRVQKALQESPSLKPYFYEVLSDSYESARNLAVSETGIEFSTFPQEIPFTPDQILDPEFFPELADC
jgi:Domain of unknown function DUF29